MPAPEYTLTYSSTVARTLATNRLPRTVIDATIMFIENELTARPRIVGKPLLAPHDGRWVARRGSYRITYQIDGTVVRILDITHRSSTYR